MKIQRILPIIYGVITAGVIGVAVLGFMLKIATDRMDAYQEQRYVSYLLADELRQSSDDLTRLARTYVVTGDARYEKMYWDVLAIRNGMKPRPDNYERIYWDLVLQDNGKPRPDTTAVPLRELMERAGFTEAEFAKLAEAHKHSDGLVKTEEIAMNMVKGRYQDGSGNFTIKGTPDFETARTLMHNAAYHQTKASIMKPIEEFQKMLAERTKKVTAQSLKRTKIIFWALQSILLGLFCSTALLFVLKNRQQELELELSRSLRESDERYRAVAQSAPDAIISADSAGNIVHWNRGAETIFGYSEAEVIGQPATLLMPSRFQEDHLAGMARMRAGGESHVLGEVVEMEGVRKDGSGFPIEFSLAAWQVADRRYYTTIIRDITERKKAEEDKDRLQAQLQQSQKMETVGRLAGGVAHDFNNLLTVVTGYSELLLQKIGKESPMHGELEQIKGAGERAALLTRQLLTFSRKQIVEPKVLDLNLLVADLGKMLIRLIGENIDLRIVHVKDLGLVKVDPSQFDQVLINLAVNARDAMPNGGTLLIETANVELDEAYCAQRSYETHPGWYVRLGVSDTGHGMTKETSQQIFEPFFTTKGQGKGTGLGLSMVYGAVKQAGGSIEAYSEVGKGTTIKIYLPRFEGEVVTPVEDDRPAVLTGGTETVLVVEDEETVRNLCVQILERLGYKGLKARDGAEAIAVAQGYGDRIDLLLTDVVMPGMNGSELATQLVLYHPKMKVLFTSGHTDDAIVLHGVLHEEVSFIGKPYTPLALATKVREVLNKA